MLVGLEEIHDERFSGGQVSHCHRDDYNRNYSFLQYHHWPDSRKIRGVKA